MDVVAVPAEHTAAVLRRLHAYRVVDRATRIGKRGPSVLIPLVAEPPFDLSRYGAHLDYVDALPPRPIARSPRERIRERLAASGIPLADSPRGWERIGDVVVVRLPESGKPQATVIGAIIGEELDAQTVLEDVSGIHGPLRLPDVRVLWGRGTETVHVEDGVRYALDVARVMFSSGNFAERSAIAERVRPGSVVVDLFAGIGYFALPIALRSRAAAVFACELNATSFDYLLRNIRMNRATSVIPRLGDCRDVAPRGIADLVVMGHFESRDYLDVAFEALRGKGTVIVHDLCPKEQYPDAFARRFAAAARAHWRDVEGMRTRIVKSYAPGIVHAVVELDVSPQTRAG